MTDLSPHNVNSNLADEQIHAACGSYFSLMLNNLLDFLKSVVHYEIVLFKKIIVVPHEDSLRV